eukprot:Phypoly_transcript_08256.p1 GENE.Phypoly_transcript_08256~~Phypoly_transcript_08256.p1  ORF type:complete len:445 (+),score=82.88 Phypoly_transcript_08256:70-1404(+)
MILSGNTTGATRSTRLSTRVAASVVQDENKLSTKAVADKKAGVVKQRSVLGDISNKLITKAVSTKAEKPAVAPAATRRVPIFAKSTTGSSTALPALVPVPSAKPPIQPTHKPSILRSDSSIVVEQTFERLAPAKHAEDPFTSAYTQDESDEDQPENMLIDMGCEPIEDIDANDRNDPTCCTEYVNEIFEYCHARELMDRVRPDYMSDQVDITERMRAILVDWMVEVHVKFKLLTETMFLSVNLVDRFLAIKPITRTKLQLVGITAMLLASKYEEIYSPELRDFIHIADKAYTREEILRMERLMLTTLDFNLSASTPLHFLRRYSKASKSDSRTHTLSKYLSELTLTEYNMLKYLPSHIAAASVYIARCMTGRHPWSATLEHYAGLREEEFHDCARDLNNVLKKALLTGAKLESAEKTSGLIFAVYKKYSSDRLLAVARLPAVEI